MGLLQRLQPKEAETQRRPEELVYVILIPPPRSSQQPHTGLGRDGQHLGGHSSSISLGAIKAFFLSCGTSGTAAEMETFGHRRPVYRPQKLSKINKTRLLGPTCHLHLINFILNPLQKKALQ